MALGSRGLHARRQVWRAARGAPLGDLSVRSAGELRRRAAKRHGSLVS